MRARAGGRGGGLDRDSEIGSAVARVCVCGLWKGEQRRRRGDRNRRGLRDPQPHVRPITTVKNLRLIPIPSTSLIHGRPYAGVGRLGRGRGKKEKMHQLLQCEKARLTILETTEETCGGFPPLAIRAIPPNWALPSSLFILFPWPKTRRMSCDLALLGAALRADVRIDVTASEKGGGEAGIRAIKTPGNRGGAGLRWGDGRGERRHPRGLEC